MNSKLTSGRFYLTVIGGIVFVYAVMERILPSEAVATILTMIFSLYFSKGNNDRPTKEEK